MESYCRWTPKPPKQRNNQIDKGEPKRERSHGARQVRDHLSLALENSEPKKETLDTEEWPWSPGTPLAAPANSSYEYSWKGTGVTNRGLGPSTSSTCGASSMHVSSINLYKGYSVQWEKYLEGKLHPGAELVMLNSQMIGNGVHRAWPSVYDEEESLFQQEKGECDVEEHVLDLPKSPKVVTKPESSGRRWCRWRNRLEMQRKREQRFRNVRQKVSKKEIVDGRTGVSKEMAMWSSRGCARLPP